MNLIYYHPIALKNKHPFHRCINPLISVLDRTENSWPNFKYQNLFPMPLIPQKQNFLELSYNRVKEIVNTSSHVTVMWSGGIDSTTMVTAFLKHSKNLDQLRIIYSPWSTYEHPGYLDFLKKFSEIGYMSC